MALPSNATSFKRSNPIWTSGSGGSALLKESSNIFLVCFSIKHLFTLIKINCCMTNPCYIRKVKSKETWLNATNSNHITWPLNQPGEKGYISSQHQSNVILPAWLPLAASTTHPQNPPTSIRTKQGWPRSGSTWELNGTADLRHVQ